MSRVRVGQFAGKHIAYLPFFVAREERLFDEVGLEVEHYPAGNDDEVYRDVANNSADFGIGDPTFVARQKPSTDSPRLVAALVNQACIWGYTHHPELPELKVPADFVTLRLACFPKPSTTFELLHSFKAKHSRLLKSMQLVETEIGYQADLLASDEADVVLDIEPMISYAESKGYRIILSVANFYKHLLFTGIVASSKILSSDPNVVENFVLAIQRGLRRCREDRSAALRAATALYPGLSESVLRNAIDRMLASHAWPEQALIEPESWKAALKLRQDGGQIHSLVDPFGYLDQRFASKALGG